MIDPSNLPPNLRAAMDRKPALVPPVSASDFMRATKANPQNARNAAETSDKRCRHLEMNIRGNCVACGKQIYIMRLDQSAGIAAQLAETAPSCPPETKSVESSMVTRFKCAVCGRLTVGRIPKGGNGTFRYPAQHFIGGTLCRGVHDEAEWVDVPRKSPRSRDPLPVSCPPEPVRVAEEAGKPPTRVLGHPDSVRFTIPGVVMGKPRMTQRDKWAKRPCVMRYRKWMDAARVFVPKLPADPIDVSWVAYLPFPKSYSKKNREALGGRPHREKPDRDNIDKGILDFLFKNDAGIAQGCMRKLWDDGYGPRLEITVI